MSRAAVNFFLDAWLLVNFLVVVWGSIAIRYVFPRGPHAWEWRLWGISYPTWHVLQFVAVIGLAVGVLLHLVLHWRWVCGFLSSRWARLTGRPMAHNAAVDTLYGVGLLAVVVTVGGLLLTWAAISAVGPAAPLAS